MKAAICTKYGPPEVFNILDVEKPILSKNEVLIKVFASTVTVADVILRSGMKHFSLFARFFARLMFGLRRPRKKIHGRELSGEVVKVGKHVKNFKVGDQVFGTPSSGAYAEYICLSEASTSYKILGPDLVIKKPINLTYEEAAAVPIGGLTALHYIKKGNIQTGQKVLIYGASGSVGTFAVQLAKYFGAEVTGVCSTKNLELVKSIGADQVIDYIKEDFSKVSQNYDVIFDAVGKISIKKLKKVLKSDGLFLSVNKGIMKKNLEDLIYLKELIEREKLRPVIDRRYVLEKITDAHAYVEKGHKVGNVVVLINHNNNFNGIKKIG